MSDNKIRIGVDTGDIRKSLLDLSKQVKSLGTSKVAIFDKKDKDFLTSQAKAGIKELKRQMEGNREEVKKALAEQKKINLSIEDEQKARKKVLDLVSKQVELQKELKDLEDFGGTVKGGIAGKVMKQGGMGGMLGGLGKMMGPMALLGGLGALGGFAFSRMSQANETFKAGVDDRLKLLGRNQTDLNLDESLAGRATKAGLNSQSMRRARLASMDVFGEAGSTQQAVLQRTEFERNFGVEQGTLTGLGAQLRPTLGGREAEKATMAIQASLIASGITDEIGPYLETAANVLTSINENGISFSDSAMALLSTVGKTGKIAPERAGKFITGIDQAIKGSTGEANAFFQEIFGQAGIGGKTLGGVQAAMRTGGLFGADIKNEYISDTDKKMFEQLGIGGRTGGKVAGGILDKLDSIFGSEKDVDKLMASKDKEQQDLGAGKRLQRNIFLMQAMGLKDERQASIVNQLLKDLKNSSSPKKQAEIKKQIENIQAGNTELGNLQKINQSTAAAARLLEDVKVNTQDMLGERGLSIFTTIEMTLINIDQILSTFLSKIPGFETPLEKIKGAAGDVDQATFDKATGNSPELRKRVGSDLIKQYRSNQAKLAEMDALGEKSKLMGIPYGVDPVERLMLKNKNKNIEKMARNINGLDIANELNIPKEQPIMMQSTIKDKTEELSDAITSLTDTLKSYFTNEEKNPKEVPLLLKGIKNATQQTSHNIKTINGMPGKSSKT